MDVSSKKIALVIIVGVIVICALVWFFMSVTSSQTVYNLVLNESKGNFLGVLNSPRDLNLSNGEYTFFVNTAVMSAAGISVQSTYLLEFTSPNKQCNITLVSGVADGSAQSNGIRGVYTTVSDCQFQGSDGEYSFKISPIIVNPLTKIGYANINIRKLK